MNLQVKLSAAKLHIDFRYFHIELEVRNEFQRFHLEHTILQVIFTATIRLSSTRGHDGHNFMRLFLRYAAYLFI